MQVESARGFGDFNDPPGLLAVANSIADVVDVLIPGIPPFGDRSIILIHNGGPQVIWEQQDHTGKEYRINITSNLGDWYQVAYQLSHELAHVKMGPARSNLLLEVLATAVSLECLTRLQSHWAKNPPFMWDGWSNYASGLIAYRNNEIILDELTRLPESIRQCFGSQSLAERERLLANAKSSVVPLPLIHPESRAWQHTAAEMLFQLNIFNNHNRWNDLLGLGTHTTPNSTDDAHFHDNLLLINEAIPPWIPTWLRQNVMIPFDKIPSWSIVAIMSRIARHIQNFAHVADRELVDEAIRFAEESARNGQAGKFESNHSEKLRKTAEAARIKGEQKACLAALCAAEAAGAVDFVKDRQKLIQAADRALKCPHDLGIPESDQALNEEIEFLAKQAYGLSDDAPSPKELLDFVRRQAIHEAGHLVAACLLHIPFDEARIIYDPGVDFTFNPIDDPDEIPVERFSDYCLAYAAGPAAQQLIIGNHQEWAIKHDRHCHGLSGGNDFEADCQNASQLAGFTPDVLEDVARLLEEKKTLTEDDVDLVQTLKKHQIPICWL